MTRLSVEGVTIRFGGVVALNDVGFRVNAGEILALIGPNGAGKTTLFNVISGLYQPSAGRVAIDGANVLGLAPHQLARRGLTRTFQNLQIFEGMNALDNVQVGRHLHEASGLLPHMLNLPSARRRRQEGRKIASDLLARVGLAGSEARLGSELPYGALKRLEIARALAAKPSVLLLDEPVAGCNATEISELDGVIRTIAGSGVAVVLVEHDMPLVMGLSDRIHVLDQGRTLMCGTADQVRHDPAVIAAYLGPTPSSNPSPVREASGVRG